MRELERIVIIGTGSIAIQHAKNLILFGKDVTFISKRDLSCVKIDGREFGVKRRLEDVADDFQHIIICSQTDEHFTDLMSALRFDKKIYVEKPLCITKAQLLDIEAHQKSHLIAECGFMMRLHPCIKYLKTQINPSEILLISCVVGQFLPDWRPAVDYRKSYSADVKKGGGVTFDLIHELDICHYLLGKLKNIDVMEVNTGELDISSNDISILNVRSENGGLAQIQLDYLRRRPKRQMEILTKNSIVTIDFLTAKLKVEKHNGEEEDLNFDYERNNMFKEMIHNFMDIQSPHISPLESALHIHIKLIEAMNRDIQTYQ